MESHRLLARTALGAAAALAAAGGLRRRLAGWGAERHEVARPLPGDELVAAPQYSATNAVTVAAAPSLVWPWLVQMGAYGRGGWYSFDRLDNAGVRSAQEIVPELQDLKVGDVLATDRDGTGFRVEAIDLQRALVLAIRAADAVTSAAFVIDPTPDGGTRLLLRVRLRAAGNLRGLSYRALMELGHVVMTRQMLLGIRSRAERLAVREARQGTAEPVSARPPGCRAPAGRPGRRSTRRPA